MCLDATQRRCAKSVKMSGVETRDVGILDSIISSVTCSGLPVDALHSAKR